MVIAIFATKTFEANSDKLYTFDGLQYDSSYQSEEQDATGTKPSSYRKGPGLDTMSFNVKLDSSFGVNPRGEWEEWQSIMNSGDVYPFILGGRPLGANNWQLVGVSPSDFNIDSDGNILSMQLGLKFTEYVREGSAKESKKSSSTNQPQGLSDAEFASLIEE